MKIDLQIEVESMKKKIGRLSKAIISAIYGEEFRDDYGNTPLWRAAFSSRGKGDMIKLLLSKGADRDNKNDSGISPAKIAHTIANYNVKQFFE